MTVQGLHHINPRDVLGWLAEGEPASPSLFYRHNMPRANLVDSAGDTHVPLVTAVLTSVPIRVAAGDLITNISVLSGATAAGTPTNQWAALYTSAATPALITQSVDRTTEAWAANTWRTFALAAPYTVPKAGVIWAAVCVVATTVPSLVGGVVCKPLLTGERNLSQSSGSGLTTTAPATIATPTVKVFCPRVVLS